MFGSSAASSHAGLRDDDDDDEGATVQAPQGFGTGIKGAFFRRVAGMSFCAFPGVQRRALEEEEIARVAEEDEKQRHLESVQAALRALQVQADVLQKDVDTHMTRADRAEQLGLMAMRQGNAVQQRVHVRNAVSQRNLATQKSARMGALQERMQGAELAVSAAQNAALTASLDVATASVVSGVHGKIFDEEDEDRTHDALTDLENIRDNDHADMATRWTEASGFEVSSEGDIEAMINAQRAMAAVELDCPVPSAGGGPEHAVTALPSPFKTHAGALGHAHAPTPLEAKKNALQDVFRT